MGHKFPTLYKHNELGNLIFWQIRVEGSDIITRYGVVNSPNIQEAGYNVYATNKGKSNERTDEEQAMFEAEAKWKHKLKYYGYKKDILELKTKAIKTKGDGGPIPMKAHRWSDHGSKINFPCFIQPKLNGLRCIAVYEGDGVELYSSSGSKIRGFNAIRSQLKSVMKSGDIFDGELYNHGLPLMTISGVVRTHPKNRLWEEESNIQFWVFDALKISNLSLEDWFRMRITELVARFGELLNWPVNMDKIRLVPTYNIKNIEDAEEKYRDIVKDGYEGMMYRAFDSTYEQKRSYKILKRKDFHEEEFQIVRFNPGDKDSTFDLAMSATCVTKDGKEFNAPLMGTEEYRAGLLARQGKYIGAWLTVKFLEYSPYGIPQIPKGKDIRWKRDM